MLGHSDHMLGHSDHMLGVLILICIEEIDYGFSIYKINHTVYNISVGQLVPTVGRGKHDIGVLPPELVFRLYNYTFSKFPTYIYRDMNNPKPSPVDKYLLFEKIIETKFSKYT